MALQIFGFRDRPHDFATTKADVPLTESVFLLDFSRPLERIRWLGGVNKWVGITVGLVVPVVHQSERSGGYVISVNRSEPYFVDIPKLWKHHGGSQRTLVAPPIGGMEIVADFAKHFPADCR
jgi:hypothetical protein